MFDFHSNNTKDISNDQIDIIFIPKFSYFQAQYRIFKSRQYYVADIFVCIIKLQIDVQSSV